jgi:hypothetical protein
VSGDRNKIDMHSRARRHDAAIGEEASRPAFARTTIDSVTDRFEVGIVGGEIDSNLRACLAATMQRPSTFLQVGTSGGSSVLSRVRLLGRSQNRPATSRPAATHR